jgi:tRNA(Ile)-lysidine synthase
MRRGPIMANTLTQRVRRRLVRLKRLGIGPRVVVAVSGGGDSVALLRLLHEASPRLGWVLTVAHLNHGARGEAADSDAGFVADLAVELGLSSEIGQWRPSRAAHFESDARRARYDWLREIALRHDANAVAVGHTRDDQAETVLHRLLRGTGLRGLAGMPTRRRLGGGVMLVRPLLDESRDELHAYLHALGQTYRVDATNADTTRTRSRIRHDLLPKLAAEYNPRIVEALTRLSRLSGQSEGVIHRDAAGLLAATTIRWDREEIVLDRVALASQPGFLRAEVFRQAWRRAGWPEVGMSQARWRRLAAMARRDRGRVSIGAGVDVLADRATLKLVRRPGGSGCG